MVHGLPRSFPTAASLLLVALATFLIVPSAGADKLSNELADRLDAHRTELHDRLRDGNVPGSRPIREAENIELMYIDHRGLPIHYIAKNLTAAETIVTHALWPGGIAILNLDGSSLAQGDLGIWDLGAVRTSHQELAGRVSWADTASYVPVDHATLVAGTMVASGVVPQAKGMSPAGLLDSYDWNNDLSEMALGAAGGMMVSNHSYGAALGWAKLPSDTLWRWFGDVSVDSTEDYYFGFYDSLSMSHDQIAYANPYYNIVVAAGNDRGEGPSADTLHWHWDANTTSWTQSSDHHDTDGGVLGYDCIDFYGTAKNIITVGSCQDIPWPSSQGTTLSVFSAMGPTDDGRIKPDVVGNGEQLFSPVAFADTLYNLVSGTSLAAPGISGSINLLIEYYKQVNGKLPLASTVKALICATAGDEGAPGPDYMMGWGRMNTLSAIYTIKDDSTAQGGIIVEDTLQDGETHTWYVQNPPGDELAVTMAWTDPAGTPPSPGLDPTTSMLVHDLDLRLVSIDGATTREPWVLSPASPANAAVTGDNTSDNVEQAVVESWEWLGEYWIVSITHKGSLQAPQAYSLISNRPLYQTLTFNDIASGPLLDSAWTRAAAFADVDSDGDDDVYLGQAVSRLLRNDGGEFADATTTPLDQGSNPAAWGDYDADGDLDLIAGPTSTEGLWRNDGDTFVAIANGPYSGFFETSANSAAWSDYDGDGDLDVFVVHQSDWNRLWRNDGAAGWIDVTAGPIFTFYNWDRTAIWYDYDADGDPDLIVQQCCGNGRFYRNDGSAVFAEIGTIPGSNEHAWGDYDNDGDLDLYTCGYFSGPNRLFRNDGNGTMLEMYSAAVGGDNVHSYDAIWADLDNDGWLDLFVVNADDEDERLYRNRGDGTFIDATVPAHFYDDDLRGVEPIDVDGDGDLDLFLFGDGISRVLRNEDSSGNWLKVTTSGGGSSKRAAGPTGSPVIGAVVEVEAGGIVQTRWIGIGGNSGTSLTAHFGLGDATVVDRIEVRWPGGGDTTVVTGVGANQIIDITAGGATDVDVADAAPSALRLYPAAPNPFNPMTTIRYEIPERSSVRLRIYDTTGRLVRTLVDLPDQTPGAGAVVWNGQNDSGHDVSSGVYLYRLETRKASETRKMLLMR